MPGTTNGLSRTSVPCLSVLFSQQLLPWMQWHCGKSAFEHVQTKVSKAAIRIPLTFSTQLAHSECNEWVKPQILGQGVPHFSAEHFLQSLIFVVFAKKLHHTKNWPTVWILSQAEFHKKCVQTWRWTLHQGKGIKAAGSKQTYFWGQVTFSSFAHRTAKLLGYSGCDTYGYGTHIACMTMQHIHTHPFIQNKDAFNETTSEYIKRCNT